MSGTGRRAWYRSGIWDAIRLEVRSEDAIAAFSAYTAMTMPPAQWQRRAAACTLDVLGGGAGDGDVYRGGRRGGPAGVSRAAGFFVRTLDNLPVAPGIRTATGARTVIRCVCACGRAGYALLDEAVAAIGFRQIIWKPCAGVRRKTRSRGSAASTASTPSCKARTGCPSGPNYADVTAEDYRKRLELYRDLGFNLLRVWGGAVLEKEPFYALCDELGIMVWQEFPLSSSGPENWPPEDPRAIAEMREITAQLYHPPPASPLAAALVRRQ